MAKSKSACPIEAGQENYSKHGTSWQYMRYLSLVSLLTTTAISLSLIILHLRRYRAPKEQRQILRICLSVIVYSLVALIELWSYGAAQYVDPIGDVYEAFGLCALFLLFLQYILPGSESDNASLEAVRVTGGSKSTFDWPKVSWFFVFQYPIVELFCVFLQEITEATGRYCTNSLSPQFAHLWIELLESFSIGACVLAIWKLNQSMKSRLKVKRSLSKLLCFKVIVFVRFFQQWVFSLLLEYHAIKTSTEYSYNDILWGIPATATCVEMVLFSLGFWYAFSATEYSSTAQGHVKPLPVGKAVLDVLNPKDLAQGMMKVIPFAIDLHKRGEWKKWYLVSREQGFQGFVRKGIRKYKDRKGGKGDRYQEFDEGMEHLTRPSETHATPDLGRHSITGGLGPGEMYQPPEGSPSDEASSFLMGDINNRQRQPSPSQSYLAANVDAVRHARASSQGSLMVDLPDTAGRPRSASVGYPYGQRFSRAGSPSSTGFVEMPDAPMHGRDMV